MSRVCEISGKSTMTGHSVSHSQRKTKRTFRVNLQKRNLIDPITGQKVSVKLSANALRTLKKWQSEGKKYDLLALKQM